MHRLISSGRFNDKKILLTDKAPKNKNDRTWCFWETGEGYFEDIVYRKWDHLWFHGAGFSKCYPTAPYQYKMIRGIDFYQYCFELISSAPNVDIRYGEVSDIHSAANEAIIHLEDKRITAELVFNSLPPTRAESGKNDHHLLQHFKGWVIETEKDAFNPAEATLMDFRVPQLHGTSFVYLMPFSTKSALVEYTLFTPKLLEDKEYDEALEAYLSKILPGIVYRVQEQEFGIIPMTDRLFERKVGKVINIGMNGGLTKPSTGYTFQFIQKDSQQLVSSLIAGKPGSPASPKPGRFRFYDSVLLNVLVTNKYPGDKLFTTMFRKNEITSIFSFLDNESSLPEDIRLISKLPFFPFLKAGIAETVKSF